MKSKFLYLLFLPLALASCEKGGIYKNFQFDYTFKATVPANAILSSPLFPLSFAEESNSKAQLEVNDTRKDLVDEMHVNTFLLEVESPQGQDMSFLNSATFYINADAEPEVRVAYKESVPSDVGNDLMFDLDDVNLAPYIRAEEGFTIRSKVVTDENRTQDITLKGTVKFDVRAQVLGE